MERVEINDILNGANPLQKMLLRESQETLLHLKERGMTEVDNVNVTFEKAEDGTFKRFYEYSLKKDNQPVTIKVDKSLSLDEIKDRLK